MPESHVHDSVQGSHELLPLRLVLETHPDAAETLVRHPQPVVQLARGVRREGGALLPLGRHRAFRFAGHHVHDVGVLGVSEVQIFGVDDGSELLEGGDVVVENNLHTG